MHPQLPQSALQLYTEAQVKTIENNYAARTQSGTFPLMLAAAQAAFLQIQNHWPQAKSILVLAGKGNNGGDATCVAQLLLKAGFDVNLCYLCEAEHLIGDAKRAYQLLDNKLKHTSTWSDIKLDDYDLVVDGLLGSGVQGAVRQPLADVITAVNQSDLPIIALDLPSGVNADTGDVVSVAIQADLTVTFVGYKRGLFSGLAVNFVGSIILDPLDLIEEDFLFNKSIVLGQSWALLQNELSPRTTAAHKGCFGFCQIIAGSLGMSGAAILAASGAALCGAGITSVWMQGSTSALLSRLPEVMAESIAMQDIDVKVSQIKPKSTLIIGPGMGCGEWRNLWMKALLTQFAQPQFAQLYKVIDADGLNYLAENSAIDNNWLLTPHPGEAARLLGTSTQAINADRFSACKEIARKYGGICVLKGAGTIISDAFGRQSVCLGGNPGMASGGMGDLLTGIIGALLAQGFKPFEAAQLGVAIHAEAADRAAGVNKYYRGLLASDLLSQLPPLLNPINPSNDCSAV